MIGQHLRTWLTICLLAVSSGCAHYHAKPLQTSSPLSGKLDALTVRIDAPHYARLFGEQKRYTVDLQDGLDEMEISILAVLNNPQLKATRKKMHVARAQLFAAGLLPDPKFGAEQQKTTGNSDPQLVNGYTYNLGFNIRSLITRHAKIDAGRATVQQVSMDILWQEWQVVQQARILFIRQHIQQKLVALLKKQNDQASTLYEHVQGLLMRHNTTLDQLGIALGSLLDVKSALTDAQRKLNKTRMNLALLLGVSPDVDLHLAKMKEKYHAMTEARLKKAINHLADFRPDLIALRHGYKSQNARLRQAILSQFPNVSIGLSRQRDTSGVWSIGPLINMSLPVLNINRGNIATARATRDKLHEEFNARMASTMVDISRIHRDQTIAFHLWQRMQHYIPKLKEVKQKAFKALLAGNMKLLNYSTIRNAYLTKRIKELSLQQSLLEQQVALSILLGEPAANISNQTKRGN